MPSRIPTATTARRGLLALAVLAGPGGAGAQVLTLKPTASLSVGHDTNVFRLEDRDDAAAVGAASVSDTIERGRVGLVGGVRTGLQTLSLTASLGRDRYERNTDLSNTNWQVAGLANLKYARLLTLDVDARAERRLESFTYRQNTTPGFSTIARTRGDLRYNIGADWSAGVAYTNYTLRNTLATSRDYNVTENGIEASAGYQRLTPWDLRLTLLHLEGRFPDRVIQPGDDRELRYDQDTLGLRGRYESSSVSQFSGEAGYTRRSSPRGDAAAFSGLTGRLSYQRTISPRTQFRVDASSLVYSVEDNTASSVQQTGATGILTWRYSPLLAFSGGFDAYRYQFRGSSAAVLAQQGGERTDTVTGLRAGAEYQAWRNLFIVPQWQYERRKSPLVSRSYDFQYFELAARYEYADAPALLDGLGLGAR